MEFLIPGLLLVGFMAWASTRIKRSATKAFEREIVETPEFSLVKPDGFLSIADPPDGLLFSAYSREYGAEPASRIRRATAEIRRRPDTDIEAIVDEVKRDAHTVLSEDAGIIGGRKCANIVTERLEHGIPLECHYKLIDAPGAVFQLVATLLPEYKEELQPKIDELLASFLLT